MGPGALGPPRSLLTVPLFRVPTPANEIFIRIDLIGDRGLRLRHRDLLDLRRAESGGLRMSNIKSLIEAYLTAERHLVAAVDAAGGAVPLPDGRTVTVGRAEFDALMGERRKRAWVIIRKQAPMPTRR
jgi:hypothetical protein